MSLTILITGASSGFGALSAKALALARHTVYAGHMAFGPAKAARAQAYADDVYAGLGQESLDGLAECLRRISLSDLLSPWLKPVSQEASHGC